MERPPASFSWSLRRRRIFEECRRRYFLTFHAAAGGSDPDSPPEARELHRLATLLEPDEYLLRLLTGEIRALFQEQPETGDAPPSLEQLLLRRFHREYGDMLFGRCETDHKLPMLAPLHSGTASAGELGRDLERKLTAAAVRCAPLMERLREIPAERRRALPVPIAVRVNELTCYATPFLCWMEDGLLYLADAAKDEAGLLLHRFFALEALRIPPERVRSLHFDAFAGTLTPSDGDLNLSRAMRQLFASAAAMRNCLLPDGGAARADFPAAEGRCRRCHFERYCSSDHSSGA